MHEIVCYKKPYLKDVILRLDFGSRVESFMRALPQKVAAAALRRFPVSEPQKAHMQEFTFSPTAVERKTADSMQWIYHGRNREKVLTITPEAFLIRNQNYESFAKFHEDYIHIVKSIFEAQKDLIVGRVGLRYINVLDIPGDDPLSWSEYINEKMLGIIDMHKDLSALTRSFHIVEFNYEGQQVKFQFGIANPDYPAPIKRRQFVLDIDSYFTGALAEEDVVQSVNASHEKIQELFEESITDKTRELMKPEFVQ